MALLWSRGCAVFFAMVIRVIFVLGIPPRVAQSAGSPEFRAHHSTSLGRPRSFLNTASGEVFAQDHLKNLFHWAYYWGGVYCENYCFDNVERLLAIFLDKSPSLRANDFTVLFIEPARTIGFKALKARNGFQRDLPTEGPSNPFLPIFYYFHVALVHQGLVYDLDYGHTPQVVTLGAYQDFFENGGRGLLAYPLSAPQFQDLRYGEGAQGLNTTQIVNSCPSLPLDQYLAQGQDRPAKTF